MKNGILYKFRIICKKVKQKCHLNKLTNAEERLRGLGTWNGRAIGASLSVALSSLVSITCKAGGGFEGGGGGALLLP